MNQYQRNYETRPAVNRAEYPRVPLLIESPPIGGGNPEETLYAAEKTSFRVILWCATLLIPLFGFLDFFMAPPSERPLFWSLRLAVTTLLILQYLFLTRSRFRASMEFHGVFFILLAGGMITYMTFRLEGFESTYGAGLILLVMGACTFMPWDYKKGLRIGACAVGPYLMVHAMTDPQVDGRMLTHHASIMAVAMFIGISAGHFKLGHWQRESLLNKSVSDMRAQTDQDHFHTSLILNPLQQKCCITPFTEIQSIVRQRQAFVYNYKRVEIGGDLNICDTLTLRHKTHALFVNVDAMGHSTQGAGGAMIFGSLFRSLIQSHKQSPDPDTGPEQWIRNTVVSLQRLFEIFEGAMPLSLALGLIDEDSGFLYLVTAQHPLVVLYRGDHGQFIEDRGMMPALGTPDFEETWVIQTLPLKQGDILIVGSNGCDVSTGADFPGGSIPRVPDGFLGRVDGAKGNIREIMASLAKPDMANDDLSLIRVDYHAVPKAERYQIEPSEVSALLQKAQEALLMNHFRDCLATSKRVLETCPGQPTALYLALKSSALAQDFKELAYFADLRSHLYPEHSDSFVLSSFAHQKLGDLDRALYQGENLRLREPHHVENLIQLAEYHMQKSNTGEANRILTRVLSRDPGHAVARKMAAAMASAMGTAPSAFPIRGIRP